MSTLKTIIKLPLLQQQLLRRVQFVLWRRRRRHVRLLYNERELTASASSSIVVALGAPLFVFRFLLLGRCSLVREDRPRRKEEERSKMLKREKVVHTEEEEMERACSSRVPFPL